MKTEHTSKNKNVTSPAHAAVRSHPFGEGDIHPVEELEGIGPEYTR